MMALAGILLASFLCTVAGVCVLGMLIAGRHDPMRRRLLAAVFPSGRSEAGAEARSESAARRTPEVQPGLALIGRLLGLKPQARIPGLDRWEHYAMLMGLMVVVGMSSAAIAYQGAVQLAWSGPVMLGGAVGVTIVAMWLSARGWVRWHARRLLEQIQYSLINVLDLWVLCLESGMSFQAAFVRVAEETELTHPEMRKQLQLTNQEILAGASREDALRHFAHRCGNPPELRSLVAHIVHAERLGSSLAHTLKVYAEDLRFKRSQDAKELIQKLPVKLAVPLVFCVLPVLLVIILGPATLRILRLLSV